MIDHLCEAFFFFFGVVVGLWSRNCVMLLVFLKRGKGVSQI